jgi:phosphomannomutase/phosphoglucomutase
MANIFHACDIRGIVGTDLTVEKTREIGLAVGRKLIGKRVVVGGDVRLSTPELQPIIAAALAEAGCDVVNIGTVSTPAFYFALQQLDAEGGVMVTASHNPAPYNGFKLVLGPKPITEEAIADIADIVKRRDFLSGLGSQSEYPILADYIEKTAKLAKRPSKPLTVVVDAGNGAAALTAPIVFTELGYDVIELFCEPDGHFPNRPPNPALSENLAALSAKVVACGACAGVAFDGDGDRVGIVDEQGNIVANDHIMVLLARYYLDGQAGAIIYDAKCSMVVPEEITKAGGRAVMARAGHTFSKLAFIEQQALFAGEISGHFFFKELGYDDGLFAGIKVCELITRYGALSKQVATIPQYLLTPDIRVPYQGNDKAAILAAMAEKLAAYTPNLIDGVRIEFADGWGMMRSSVTEPLFTLRFEATTLLRLQAIEQLFLDVLPEKLYEIVHKKILDCEGFLSERTNK